MVGSISSSSMIMPQMTQSSSSSSKLISSQLDTISSVLEDYDASNLTASDAQSIVKSFEKAGIQPSSELASVMEELGFNAQEVGALAGGGKQDGMPPPPPPSDEEVSSISSLLDSLLNTDEDDTSTSISSTSTSFEDVLDYTSRILSLNDSSKDKIMSLLDKYSSEDSQYSQSETNTLLKASLNEVLSDSNNYKSVSFYG